MEDNTPSKRTLLDILQQPIPTKWVLIVFSLVIGVPALWFAYPYIRPRTTKEKIEYYIQKATSPRTYKQHMKKAIDYFTSTPYLKKTSKTTLVALVEHPPNGASACIALKVLYELAPETTRAKKAFKNVDDIVKKHFKKKGNTHQIKRLQCPSKMSFQRIMIRSHLIDASFPMADFSDAYMPGVLMLGATLKRANFTHANLSGAILRGAFLQGAKLKHTELMKTDLQYTNLTNASLIHAKLRGANLSGALLGADFSHADLRETTLDYANFKGATLKNTNLKGASYNSATQWPTSFDPKQHKMTCSDCSP